MKYPIQNDFAYALLWTVDTFLKSFTIFQRKKNLRTDSLKKLLICNGAHLGDVILSTALLAPLKKAYPDLEIGMVVGSWAKKVVQDHEVIRWIHTVDHWKLNRTDSSFFKKMLSYLRSRSKALQEIARVEYDVAIDCNFHFPNMAYLLWRAKIPIRIGFASAGLGPLLTRAYPWDPLENREVTEVFFSLLQGFSVQRPQEGLRPWLPLQPEPKRHYIAIHMGSGDPQKQWPLHHWKELCRQLFQDGHSLVFTGYGEAESLAIEEIRKEMPHIENLSNRLNWKEFVKVIQQAQLLISVDTSAAHVASATETSAIILFTGIHPSKLWHANPRAKRISHSMPCSPCLKGCQRMHCIQAISVKTVYEEVLAFFSSSSQRK